MLFHAHRRIRRADGDWCALRFARPEYFHPCARSLEPVRRPHLAEFGNQRVLVLLKIVHQFLRNLSRKRLVGRGTVVAGVFEDAHLVFDLNHENGVFAAIDLAQVSHTRRKGAGIGVAVGVAEGRQREQALTLLVLNEREPRLVHFYPERLVIGLAVLPTTEPKEHETQIVSSCFFDQRVHQREIELALLRLDQFPARCGEYGVEVRRHEPRPERFHVVEAGRAGIVQLRAQNEEGFAVHDQLPRRALLLEERRRGNRFRLRCATRHRDREADNTNKGIPMFHSREGRNATGLV